MKQTNKKLQRYHNEHPYAASHPYSKGPKLKPEGAPSAYPPHKSGAKHKALEKVKHLEVKHEGGERKLKNHTGVDYLRGKLRFVNNPK